MLLERTLILLLAVSFTASAGGETAPPSWPVAQAYALDPDELHSSFMLATTQLNDISGRYQSVISTKRGKRRAIVTLEQTGHEVVATWEDRPRDRLVGSLNGNRIEFEWYNSRAGYDLVGFWIVHADRIEGRWERPDGASGGRWVLTPVE